MNWNLKSLATKQWLNLQHLIKHQTIQIIQKQIFSLDSSFIKRLECIIVGIFKKIALAKIVYTCIHSFQKCFISLFHTRTNKFYTAYILYSHFNIVIQKLQKRYQNACMHISVSFAFLQTLKTFIYALTFNRSDA